MKAFTSIKQGRWQGTYKQGNNDRGFNVSSVIVIVSALFISVLSPALFLYWWRPSWSKRLCYKTLLQSNIAKKYIWYTNIASNFVYNNK